MFTTEKFKMKTLLATQLILSIGSFITFLYLKESGLLFAAFSGWVFADFIKTLKSTKDE